MNSLCGRIILLTIISVSLLAVTAAALPAPVHGEMHSAFQDDPRLGARVTLGPAILTLGQLVVEMNRAQSRIRFSAATESEDESVSVWIRDRPLLEAMEAVSIAGRFDWQATLRGYRLHPTDRPVMPRTMRTPEPQLDADAALVAAVAWPPAFPAMVVQANPKPRAAYHPNPFGAALAEIGRQSKVSLVAMTPVLRGAARFADPRKKIASARGCDVMKRIAEMDGGHWTRLGATYALSLPAEVLDLRRTPMAVRQQELNLTAERILRSLSAGQLKELRTGGSVKFVKLSPSQRTHMARLARLHHSIAPIHAWNAVTNPAGWNLSSEGEAVIFGLLPGGRAPIIERPLQGSKSTADQP